jgi:hemerythrin
MGEKPEMLKQIDDHLRAHLDKKDRWMIAQAKQKLHMM